MLGTTTISKATSELRYALIRLNQKDRELQAAQLAFDAAYAAADPSERLRAQALVGEYELAQLTPVSDGQGGTVWARHG